MLFLVFAFFICYNRNFIRRYNSLNFRSSVHEQQLENLQHDLQRYLDFESIDYGDAQENRNNNNHNNPSEQQLIERRESIKGLTSSQLKKLKVQEIKDGKEDNLKWKNETCSICIGDYKDRDKLIALDCKHFYHQKCAKNWLKRKAFCPNCKTQVIIE